MFQRGAVAALVPEATRRRGRAARESRSQGADQARAWTRSRARTRIASGTSSFARSCTARCRKRSARSCTSGLRSGSSRLTSRPRSSATRSSATTWSRRSFYAASSVQTIRSWRDGRAARLFAAGQNALGRADLPRRPASSNVQSTSAWTAPTGRTSRRCSRSDRSSSGAASWSGPTNSWRPSSRLRASPATWVSSPRLASATTRSGRGSTPDASVEAELEEAMEIAASLEGSQELAALVTVHLEIGTCKFQLGRAGEGEDDLARAVDTRTHDRRRRAAPRHDGSSPAPGRLGADASPQGIALVEELLAADYANASLRAQALHILSLFRAMQGEFEPSRRAAEDAWSLIEEFDLRLVKGIYSGDVGCAELIARDLDRAEFVLRRGHDALLEMGDVGVRSTVDGVLSDVLFLQGRHDEALELADESRAIAAPDDLDSQPRSRAARARVLASRGLIDEALELLDEAVAARRADRLPRAQGLRVRRARGGSRTSRPARGRRRCRAAGRRLLRAEGQRRVRGTLELRLDGLRAARPPS